MGVRFVKFFFLKKENFPVNYSWRLEKGLKDELCTVDLVRLVLEFVLL